MFELKAETGRRRAGSSPTWLNDTLASCRTKGELAPGTTSSKILHWSAVIGEYQPYVIRSSDGKDGT